MRYNKKMEFKGTMKYKTLNVSVLFFLIFYTVIAQQDLGGTFCKTPQDPGLGSCFEFSGGTFKYTSGGDSFNYFGEGTYSQKGN
jgi:hypothetical protein